MSSELQLMRLSLEKLGDADIDLTQEVYARFFSACPSARTLFSERLESTPGRMLNEVFECLLDQASGKGYLADLMHVCVNDHRSYGLNDASQYAAFLDALLSALAAALGPEWHPAEAQAWKSQCNALLQLISNAECKAPRATTVLS